MADAQEVAEPAAEAREWYQTGVDLYRRESFAPALDAFRRAFALVARPQLHFNMGRCLSRLGRHRDALTEFQAAADSSELSEQERGRARAELLVTRAELGVLRLTGSGRAEVDGAPCVLPCELELDPGEHSVAFGEREQSVTLARGERLELELLPIIVERPLPIRRGYRPGVGTMIGASLIAVGAAGAIGFGLRANSLVSDFDRSPRSDTAEDGERAKLLANLSIGVAVVGALIWLTEILIGSLRTQPAEAVSSRPRPTAW